jgi:hypothetical protein
VPKLFGRHAHDPRAPFARAPSKKLTGMYRTVHLVLDPGELEADLDRELRETVAFFAEIACRRPSKNTWAS